MSKARNLASAERLSAYMEARGIGHTFAVARFYVDAYVWCETCGPVFCVRNRRRSTRAALRRSVRNLIRGGCPHMESIAQEVGGVTTGNNG